MDLVRRETLRGQTPVKGLAGVVTVVRPGQRPDREEHGSFPERDWGECDDCGKEHFTTVEKESSFMKKRLRRPDKAELLGEGVRGFEEWLEKEAKR